MSFGKSKSNKVSKLTQKLIPYNELSANGILKNNKGSFSQVYKTERVKINEKELRNLLSNFDYHNRYQILIDICDNQMDIYLTEIIKAKNMKEAQLKFSLSEKQIKNIFEELGIEIRKLDFEERIEFLHDFYRYKEDEAFEFDNSLIKNHGKAAKKIITPYSLSFGKKHFEMNSTYGKISALKNINMNFSESNIIDTLLKLKCERMLFSINFKTINTEKALKIIEKNISLNFRTDQFIPYEFRNSINEIREKLNRVINNKENLFLVNGTFINLSENLNDLEKDYKKMKAILEYKGYKLYELIYDQKNGLNTTLSFGNNDLQINDTLTTSEFTKLIPF